MSPHLDHLSSSCSGVFLPKPCFTWDYWASSAWLLVSQMILLILEQDMYWQRTSIPPSLGSTNWERFAYFMVCLTPCLCLKTHSQRNLTKDSVRVQLLTSGRTNFAKKQPFCHLCPPSLIPHFTPSATPILSFGHQVGILMKSQKQSSSARCWAVAIQLHSSPNIGPQTTQMVLVLHPPAMRFQNLWSISSSGAPCIRKQERRFQDFGSALQILSFSSF